ncbi:DNA-binding transcriptional LysR family regulator [Crenobacter luteus]|uniref:LysR family transcriptional regulator n=1 Tax=Crenobacter luteus TaxID=1452487 RepID=UPI00104B4E02|nr:LysR family transcriptional regulator [Crenobacter luteus]TCP12496.1 DNA-binding transcriptional LysR family regulator [Crenobacter luteus]
MKLPRTAAEQWRILQAVVEAGGFAQAAKALHRSQSAVSYAVARLQEQLGVPLLEPQGRRMVLTGAGAALLRDAIPLVDSLTRLEERARALTQGWEAEVRLAVDSLFPTEPLLSALSAFAGHCATTRLQLIEVVMSGADDALYAGQAELVVGNRVPAGFLGDWLLDAEFVAVAAPCHPLFALGRTIAQDDLAAHTQVVVRDSGTREPRDEGWLGARQRWTVGNTETSIATVEAGLAFAWLPRHRIAAQLADGRLAPLPLASGRLRHSALYLIYADADAAGPATRELGGQLAEAAAAWRTRHGSADVAAP